MKVLQHFPRHEHRWRRRLRRGGVWRGGRWAPAPQHSTLPSHLLQCWVDWPHFQLEQRVLSRLSSQVHRNHSLRQGRAGDRSCECLPGFEGNLVHYWFWIMLTELHTNVCNWDLSRMLTINKDAHQFTKNSFGERYHTERKNWQQKFARLFKCQERVGLNSRESSAFEESRTDSTARRKDFQLVTLFSSLAKNTFILFLDLWSDLS